MDVNLQTVQKGEAESADKDRDLESRLADTEGRLKEAENERDNYKNVCWFTKYLQLYSI